MYWPCGTNKPVEWLQLEGSTPLRHEQTYKAHTLVGVLKVGQMYALCEDACLRSSHVKAIRWMLLHHTDQVLGPSANRGKATPAPPSSLYDGRGSLTGADEELSEKFLLHNSISAYSE